MGSLKPKELVATLPTSCPQQMRPWKILTMSSITSTRANYADLEDSMKHKKKRSIFCKFGDLFRRKSFYKLNLAPVHTL